MKNTILVLALVGISGSVVALAATPPATPPSCGQMMSQKAVLPAKMNELMTAVADMMDAHAAISAAMKTKEGTAEADTLKVIAKQHRDLAAQFAKTADSMKGASTLAAVPHDMQKMMADPKLQEASKRLLATEKEMLALIQKDVSDMEAMSTKKVN